MKKWVGFISSIVVLVIGIIFFGAAQLEIASSYGYTWRAPYTSYEAKVLLIKWIGLAFIIIGIGLGILLGISIAYTNKHIQDIDRLAQKGGTIRCTNCGLTVAADVSVCPRCNSAIKSNAPYNIKSNSIRICKKCGNSINNGELFCTKCGQKID